MPLPRHRPRPGPEAAPRLFRESARITISSSRSKVARPGQEHRRMGPPLRVEQQGRPSLQSQSRAAPTRASNSARSCFTAAVKSLRARKPYSTAPTGAPHHDGHSPRPRSAAISVILILATFDSPYASRAPAGCSTLRRSARRPHLWGYRRPLSRTLHAARLDPALGWRASTKAHPDDASSRGGPIPSAGGVVPHAGRGRAPSGFSCSTQPGRSGNSAEHP